MRLLERGAMKREKKLKQQQSKFLQDWPAGCKVLFWLGPKTEEPFEGRIIDVTVCGKVQLAAYVQEATTRKILVVPMTRLQKVG